MTCKHYYIKYEKHICTDCGQEFYICPVCARYVGYGWCCAECERKHRRAIKVMAQSEAGAIEESER